MIEVNLLPGGKKRGGRTSPLAGVVESLKGLGRRGGGGGGAGQGDPYMAFFAVAASVAVGYMAWSFLSARSNHEELQVRLQEEQQDSVRFADLIQRTSLLTARNDSIAQRVAIIQEIDAGRYVWPHVLDEIAQAVPEYTWLREVLYAGGEPMQIRLNGRAGSIYAITNFMRQLESSRFFRAVTMDRAEQAPSETNPEDLVYVFELVLTYDPPPLDELETVPLFEPTESAAQMAEPAAGGN